MSELLKKLDSFKCEIQEWFPMDKYVTLKVGGLAEAIVYPNNYENLIETLNTVHSSGLKLITLGAGSNTIITEKGVNGVVLSTKKLRNLSINQDDTVLAECGSMLSTIMNKTIKCGLTGFEFAAGIPGTVGGGIYMNAGANDGEIKDVVEKVWIWHDGKEIELSKDDIKFEYRKTDLPQGCVITKALFKLKKGNQHISEKNVKEYLEYRNRTQPVNKANTGSIFKNPEEIPAGKLLEELGLKGSVKGGAMFSDLHANFIINTGNASAKDVIDLIQSAKQKALSEKGIKLETEVEILGE